VLQHVAALLESAVREQDVVARWGGEEFVLLLPEATVESATSLAETLRTTLAGAPFVIRGNPTALTMTFGVGEADPDSTVDDWIAAADRALYDGKASGRDRVVMTAS